MNKEQWAYIHRLAARHGLEFEEIWKAITKLTASKKKSKTKEPEQLDFEGTDADNFLECGDV